MATLNGVKAIFSGSNPGREENATQSLEHIVLNAIKQKAKQVKKGHEETAFPPVALSHASLSATRPELHASLGKWRESGRGKINLPVQSETRAEVSKTVNTRATEAPLDKGVPMRKTTLHHDLSALSASVGEKTAVASGVHGLSAAVALQERRDTPLSHAIASQVTDTAVFPSTSIPSEAPGHRTEREHTPSGIPLTSDAQHRMFTGDTAARSADNAFAGAGRQPLPSEAILRNIGNTALNEAASEGQLLYRFSDWGDGHQVNVLLGGHAKAPHVLQVSDPLVHQRLADYEGQGQSDPEWVFSEDDEQPKKEHSTFADEGNA
ncbi:SpaN/EivJ family type III secretion system needle length determinant [Symbiopectobacterium purcellii]|uniref:SpaN/EivJ family type III secretion system needle length determinant n=1 Tax=Symbiopectobacterium purcellii TaxID=2871826 RepID=UPI003F85AD15